MSQVCVQINFTPMLFTTAWINQSEFRLGTVHLNSIYAFFSETDAQRFPYDSFRL